MTSGGTFPPKRLTAIDDLTRADHSYLEADDECYFLGEYTARKGFGFSETNGVILNFKKSMDRRGKPEWRYKDRAIKQAAAAFWQTANKRFLRAATLVPIPPSKAKSDPMYDDRVVRMLRAIDPDQALDIRDLVTQARSLTAAHEGDDRPGPDAIQAACCIEQSLLRPKPASIALFDDLLVTGARFKATKAILQQQFPRIRVVGMFIARRVPDLGFEALDI